MDKLRVSKVERVTLQHDGKCDKGTLHLTNHHLIFVGDDLGEVWIAYSLLWLVTRLPALVSRQTKQRIYPLLFQLRHYVSYALALETDTVAHDVFESIRALAVVEAPHDLYAFYYQPKERGGTNPSGWKVFDVKQEFERQGIGRRTKAWRLCDVNAGYGLSASYPALFAVPSRISDSTIRYAAKFRSKERLPALTYLHRTNLASITRCSQPMVGLNNRSTQDEKLVEAIFGTHDDAAQSVQASDAAIAFNREQSGERRAMVYGSTLTNLIIDARPTTNAMANRAKGAGTENMDFYRGCKKVYLGIDNIHVMRDSLNKATLALRMAEAPATFAVGEGDPATVPIDHMALKRSGWLKHISTLLEGCLVITRNVHVSNSHVLIHCSDGWDRTSQLAALAQICLDPYFRTRRGFAVLVEKDWVSFGHRFWDRCGHASSDRYFVAGNRDDGERATVQGVATEGSGLEEEEEGEIPAVSEAQAAANAFWDFTKQIRANFQPHDSRERGAHLKEISPVFHQFLDCVWQIMRQYPRRFEFNEQWLLDLFRHHFECKYGTFLYNSESERNGFFGASAPASSRTTSVWDEMLSEESESRYINSRYEPSLDEDYRRADADMGVLMPNAKDVGFWGALFKRDSTDLNKLVVAEAEERRVLVERLRKEDEERQRQEAQHASETAANMSSPVYQTTYKARTRHVARDPVVMASPRTREVNEREAWQGQEAADRVKGFFSGWSTRLQDAYVSATSVATSPVTEDLPRVVEAGDFVTVDGGDSAPQRISTAPQTDRGGHHENPWATMPALADTLAGDGPIASVKPNEQVSGQSLPRMSQEEEQREESGFDPLGVSHV